VKQVTRKRSLDKLSNTESEHITTEEPPSKLIECEEYVNSPKTAVELEASRTEDAPSSSKTERVSLESKRSKREPSSSKSIKSVTKPKRATTAKKLSTPTFQFASLDTKKRSVSSKKFSKSVTELTRFPLPATLKQSQASTKRFAFFVCSFPTNFSVWFNEKRKTRQDRLNELCIIVNLCDKWLSNFGDGINLVLVPKRSISDSQHGLLFSLGYKASGSTWSDPISKCEFSLSFASRITSSQQRFI
jgi:hypothetical protein